MNVRHAIQVRGLIQGVGFRPYVHRLASGLGLSGFVRNQVDHVLIEVEGDCGALA
jgi:hydrogenase maturation protein HypF